VTSCRARDYGILGRQRTGFHAPQAASLTNSCPSLSIASAPTLIRVAGAGCGPAFQVGDDHRIGRAVSFTRAQRQFEMRESRLDLVELLSDAR